MNSSYTKNIKAKIHLIIPECCITSFPTYDLYFPVVNYENKRKYNMSIPVTTVLNMKILLESLQVIEVEVKKETTVIQ